MQLDKTTRIAIPVLIVLAIILAALLPWRCSAQTNGTAGTITLSIDYTAQQDADMTAEHGPDWQAWLQSQLQEAARNHQSTAQERAVRRDAALLRSSEIRSQEREAVEQVIDSVRTREERKRQVPDTGKVIEEPIQTRGELKIESGVNRAAVAELIGINVGKAASPRMAFLGSLLAPPLPQKPSPAPPSGLPFNESTFITYIYVVHILAIIGLAATCYMIYTGVTM